jgi:hypothetical protein
MTYSQVGRVRAGDNLANKQLLTGPPILETELRAFTLSLKSWPMAPFPFVCLWFCFVFLVLGFQTGSPANLAQAGFK